MLFSMAHTVQHIDEIDEQFPPIINGRKSYQIRRRFREREFEQLLKQDCPDFIETFHDFMKGKTLNMSARIDTDSDSYFKWRIKYHRGNPGGVKDWKDKPMGSFEYPWGRHFERSAMEYAEAKKAGFVCHDITQCIEGVYRRYVRVVVPKGSEILVAAANVPSKEGPDSEAAKSPSSAS